MKIYPSFGSYIQQYLTSIEINNKIISKGKLIPRYIKNTGTSRIWLLIVIDEPSEDSFNIKGKVFTDIIENEFERIYVLDGFFSEVYRIK